MGIKLFSSSQYDRNEPVNYYDSKYGNPDPYRFDVLTSLDVGNFCVVKVRYPTCHNFEGIKILVFKNRKAAEIMKFEHIDPHFSNNSEFDSPIARFVPTEEGWNMAIAFVKFLNT